MGLLDFIKAKKYTDAKVNLLEAGRDMYYKQNGNNAWIRTPFNATYDLVQKIVFDRTAGNPSAQENPIWGFVQGDFVPVATAKDFTTAWAGTQILYNLDDVAPLYYNATYIGGGHAAAQVRAITVASHDKTVADLGSKWTDGAAKEWWLVKIQSPTVLWVMPSFGSSGTSWVLGNLTFTGTTLTHVSGATHTTSIEFSAPATTQMHPGVRNESQAVLLDGQITPVDGVVYKCKFVDIIQDYDIPNPKLTLDYMKVNIGKQIYEAIEDASVSVDVHDSFRYRFFPNSSYVVARTSTFLSRVVIAKFGMTQNAVFVFTGGRRVYQYIPYTNDYTVTGTVFNFKNIQEITGNLNTKEWLINSAGWTDANNPPFRFTQLVREADGVTPVIGMTTGYSLQKGRTVPATRKLATTGAAFMLSTAEKQYPYVAYNQEVAANTFYEALAFVGYFDPAMTNGATVFQYYQEGNDIIALVDFHSTVAFKKLPLPAEHVGKTVTVLTSDGSITVHSGLVTNEGIVVSVTDYGSATIKIS